MLWTDVTAMRHRLVHADFDIDLDSVWQTLKGDLPSLSPVGYRTKLVYTSIL
ncbi:MAG: HepT-like ribonuclease domain-containing protein [Gammaproteobacteria bacterium]